MKGLSIRAERPGDISDVRRIHDAAFAGRTAEGRLVDRLRSAGKAAVSLVAEIDGRVVGHIAFSPVEIEAGSGPVAGLGLAPVSVVPDLQGRGIGSALITAGLEECRQRGCSFVVVLGEPGFYSRFGFERARSFGLSNEYGADEEFRIRVFQPGALPVDGGLVKYADEFAGLDV